MPKWSAMIPTRRAFRAPTSPLQGEERSQRSLL